MYNPNEQKVNKMSIDEKTKNTLVMSLIVMTDMLDEAKAGGFEFNEDIIGTANKMIVELNDIVTEQGE